MSQYTLTSDVKYEIESGRLDIQTPSISVKNPNSNTNNSLLEHCDNIPLLSLAFEKNPIKHTKKAGQPSVYDFIGTKTILVSYTVYDRFLLPFSMKVN